MKNRRIKSLKYFFLIGIASLFIFSSCKTYDDGPSFTLLSATSRLTGSWKIDKVLVNNVEEPIAQDSVSVKFTFERGGDGKISFTYLMYTFSTDLEWEFVNDKDDFKMRIKDFTSGEWSPWEESEILKLTNKEFHLKRIDIEDGVTYVTVTKMKKS